jgi:hypothetical protein
VSGDGLGGECRERAHVGRPGTSDGLARRFLSLSLSLSLSPASHAGLSLSLSLDGLARQTASSDRLARVPLHAALVAQLSLSNLRLPRCRLDEVILTTASYIRC